MRKDVPHNGLVLSSRQHNPWKLVERDVRAVQQMLASEIAAEEGETTKDFRLSNAQFNRGILTILKGEPLFYLAALVSRYMNPRSKLKAKPEVIRRILLDLHDRMYPTPDHRTRKNSSEENQFELDFQWSVDGGGGKVATLSDDDR